MAGNLRTEVKPPNTLTTRPPAQSGGRKRRKSKGKTHRRRRSRKAGSSCGTKQGGSSMGKSRSAKGGMGLGAVIKEALVPFGLFAWQKRTQKRSPNGIHSKMTRRR